MSSAIAAIPEQGGTTKRSHAGSGLIPGREDVYMKEGGLHQGDLALRCRGAPRFGESSGEGTVRGELQNGVSNTGASLGFDFDVGVDFCEGEGEIGIFFGFIASFDAMTAGYAVIECGRGNLHFVDCFSAGYGDVGRPTRSGGGAGGGLRWACARPGKDYEGCGSVRPHTRVQNRRRGAATEERRQERHMQQALVSIIELLMSVVTSLVGQDHPVKQQMAGVSALLAPGSKGAGSKGSKAGKGGDSKHGKDAKQGKSDKPQTGKDEGQAKNATKAKLRTQDWNGSIMDYDSVCSQLNHRGAGRCFVTNADGGRRKVDMEVGHGHFQDPGGVRR